MAQIKRVNKRLERWARAEAAVARRLGVPLSQKIKLDLDARRCYARNMGRQTVDRMTLIFSTKADLKLASEIRTMAKKNGGINRMVKEILREWVHTRVEEAKNS